MTNVRLTLVIFATCVTGAASLTSGQAKEISKTEYDAISQAAYSTLAKATYRIKRTPSVNKASIATEQGAVISSVSEFAPGDRRRVVTVLQTATGTRKEETIKIGDQEFMRTNDGPWEDLSKKKFDRFTLVGDAAVESKESSTYRHLGTENVRGIYTELYEEVVYEEIKFKDRTISYSYLNRLWISKDGRPLGNESKHSGSNGIVTASSTSEYEYDPGIKIELPAIKVK
jgi:hypothetical protein